LTQSSSPTVNLAKYMRLVGNMPTSYPQQIPRSGPTAKARTSKKRITDDEWLSHKANIERLYLEEGRDVREVRDTMKREFAFEAQ